MPVDLFYPTGAPTCLIVIKAHTPNNTLGTLLAKVHNDGFTISKNKRVQTAGSQLPDVLEVLTQFRKGKFRTTIPSLACVVDRLNLITGQELCAEQWLPQAKATREEMRQLADQVLRQVYLSTVHYPTIVESLVDDYENQLADIEGTAIPPTTVTTLDSVFDLTMGKSTGLSNYPGGSTPYISSGDTYNSIVGMIEPEPSEIYDMPVVPVTGFGQATLQPWRFCARGNGGSAVRILVPRFAMSLSELIWYICQINRQRWRFNYGRMALITRIEKLHIEPYPRGWNCGAKGIVKKVMGFHQQLLQLLPDITI